MPIDAAIALLVASALLFGIFFLNVLFGASGLPLFLSSIAELLCLCASCVMFVAATLRLEKYNKN